MASPKKIIRHPLPSTRWPDADTAAKARWFQPIDIGPIRAKTRTWVPAMVPWRASPDGEVTDAVIAWYERFARGKPGVLVVEATGIREVPSGPLLRIGDDRFLPGLRKLVETVRRASDGETRLFIQIIDFLTIRRRPEKDKFFGRFLQVTEVHRNALRERNLVSGDVSDSEFRTILSQLNDDILVQILTTREFQDYSRGHRESVNDTHLPHIAELPQVLPKLFASAAGRAQAAGFDGVELHYAHAYTMASFLSRLNDRDDGYGGDLAARARLPLEIYQAVRASVGPNFCVGCRMLGDEVIEGGSKIDDAIRYASRFAEAGMDFLSISKGGKFEDAKQPNVGDAAYPYTGPSGQECMPTVRSDARGPFGRNTNLAAAIRKAVRAQGLKTPIVTAGGIGTFELAEQILHDEQADIVASARQSLADPDWFEKIRCGQGEAIMRCKFTNYCEGLDQKHKEVTCQLWDRDFSPGAGVALSHCGKRRLLAPEWKHRIDHAK